MSFDDFFKEWKETNKKMIGFAVSEVIVLFLVLWWIVVNVPEESYRATIFTILIIVAAIVAGLDTIKESNLFFSYVDYGQTPRNAVIAVLVGGFAGLVLTGQSFSLLQPLAVVGLPSMVFFYTVVAAPLAEEKFFRGFLNPSAGGLMKIFDVPNPYFVGIVFSSIVFGLFHWIAYGGAINALFMAIIFGLIVSVGNQFFKSRAFSVGMHVVVNFIVIGGFTALTGLV